MDCFSHDGEDEANKAGPRRQWDRERERERRGCAGSWAKRPGRAVRPSQPTAGEREHSVGLAAACCGRGSGRGTGQGDKRREMSLRFIS